MRLDELLAAAESGAWELPAIYQRWLDITEAGAVVRIGIGKLRGPNAAMVLSRAQVLGRYYAPGAATADQFYVDYHRGRGALLDDGQRSVELTSRAMLQLMLLSISQMADSQSRDVALPPSWRAVLIWWTRWLSAGSEALRDQAFTAYKGLGADLASLLAGAGHGDLAEPWLRWQMTVGHGAEVELQAAVRLAGMLNRQRRYAEALAVIDEALRHPARDFQQFTLLTLLRFDAYKRLRWPREAWQAVAHAMQRMVASPDPRVLPAYLRRVGPVLVGPKALRALPSAVRLPWRMLTSSSFRDRVRRTLVRLRYLRRAPLALTPVASVDGQPQRIAVLRLDKLGDLVCMLPALAAIRRRYPDARIDCFVTRGLEAIAEMCPDIDQVHGVPWKARGDFGRFLRRVGQTRYDLVIDLLEQEKPYEVRLLAAFDAAHKLGFDTAARRRLCDKRAKSPYWRSHLVDQSMWLLRPLGIEPARGVDRRPRLHLSQSQRQAGLDVLREAGVMPDGRPLVGVHPGSGWRYKRWYPKRFAQVADRLYEQGAQPILFIGTAKEKALVQEVRDAMTHTPLVVGPLDLARFAAAVSLMDLMLVNDSGPMHVCGAVGVPMVVVWGPGDLEMFAPLAKDCRVIYDRPACANCPQEGNPRRCPMGYKYEEVPCLTPITVDRVAQAAEELLEGRRVVRQAVA